MSDTPAVSTVQVIDPRIEPQPEPVYANTIGPDQNQFYRIPASGISDSYVTFNNLTTLGKDRAYLDTFELEITVDVTFKTDQTVGGWAPPPHGYFMPISFPFNSVCEQARVNINGGAFFNSPMATIRAKERYWDDEKLQESFANHTPCQKPFLQDELASREFGTSAQMYYGIPQHYRTRMFGQTADGFASRANGPLTSTNFAIMKNYSCQAGTDVSDTLTITWREPIFCSPFSSRYDATYGRPLYNITSIDMAFNLVDLRNMFLVVNRSLAQYEVHFKDVQLCYQVLTVTAPLNHSFTVVPYRRYVPYITNVKGPNPDGTVPADVISHITATSGVYTLNEVPTAIWVFLAPELSEYQRFDWDGIPADAAGQAFFTNSSRHTNNKLFGFMTHISISCGNTTQILNTASVHDLYRIAKANGCQDNFDDWSRADPFNLWQHQTDFTVDANTFEIQGENLCVPGCGSVLRLIPGTDIVLPEQKLTPGANANNLVFQVEAEFDYNGLGSRIRKVALWLLFEYVGVASITPGNCVVTMNPLGNGAIMAAAPTVSGTTSENEAAPSTTEGSGWLDKIKSALGVANKLAKDTKIVSSALKFIPGVGDIASNIASQFGYGYKRPRLAASVDSGGAVPGGSISGGAVMGLGDFC